MKKDKIIYSLSVILCIGLLFIGYFTAIHGKSYYAEDGGEVYLRARVEEIITSIPVYGDDGEILSEDTVFEATVTRGDMKGETVTVYQNYSSYTPFNPRTVAVGDSVIIAHFEGVQNWNFIDFVRSDAIIVLALLFGSLLIVFGRKKGLKTVLSLVLTVISVVFVFMPAIITGGNVYFWAVAVCIYIIFMTLIITDGISKMSLSAAIGCAGGVFASLLLTFITDAFVKITGNADPHSIYLLYIGEGLDLRALIYASIIIGSVGAVMDVAVDIAASLKEIASKVESPTKHELFRSGINIGRDVIGTMSNTLILAYIGGSMCSLLLYFYNNYSSPLYLFNIEIIIVELLQILVGSIGILLTLPLTAFVSAVIYTAKRTKKARHATDGFSDMLDAAGEFESACKNDSEDEVTEDEK